MSSLQELTKEAKSQVASLFGLPPRERSKEIHQVTKGSMYLFFPYFLKSKLFSFTSSRF
jgi:hypothetical protein